MLGVVGLTWTDGFDVLGWYTAPDLTGRNLRVLKYQGAGGDDGPFAHLAVVEQRGTHADEGAVADGAGVDGDVVADGDVAADMGGARFVGHVDAGAVLHIGAVADGAGCHVAAHHGVEPHRTLVAQCHNAYQRGVLAEVAVLAPPGRLPFV